MAHTPRRQKSQWSSLAYLDHIICRQPLCCALCILIPLSIRQDGYRLFRIS